MILEPMIRDFKKLNSNTGWCIRDESLMDDIAQALSHFSYHVTRGNQIICDIQGGNFNKGFALSDPVIMSNKKGQFGKTDLGKDGIITFFAHHVLSVMNFAPKPGIALK